MKKIIVLLITLVGGFTLASCQEGIPNTWEDIENRGYFIVGLDDTFAPMGFRDNDGNIVGFDVDLANAVANYLDIDIKFQPIDWDSKVLELEAGTIDMIWNGLTITDERLEQMSFSDAYVANAQIIITQGDSDIDKIEDLAGKKVGYQVSSAAEPAVENSDVYEQIGEIVKYDAYDQAMLELKNGIVDAIVVDEIFGRYAISQAEEGVYKVASENFGDEDYGIGFRLDATDIRDTINAALEAIAKDGTAQEISESWFNENIFLIS